MSQYYYFASDDKKQYLKCPGLHCPKSASYLEEGHCISKLLPYLISGSWNGSKISVYCDSDDLPWDNDEEWIDITIDTIQKYNEHGKLFVNGEWEYDPEYFIKCNE